MWLLKVEPGARMAVWLLTLACPPAGLRQGFLASFALLCFAFAPGTRWASGTELSPQKPTCLVPSERFLSRPFWHSQGHGQQGLLGPLPWHSPVPLRPQSPNASTFQGALVVAAFSLPWGPSAVPAWSSIPLLSSQPPS